MMMKAIVLTMLAGVANGSYAFGIKHLDEWPNEWIWLNFSIFAFLFFPIVLIGLFVPHLFSVLSLLNSSSLVALAVGGFVFAIGMILSTLSLRFIGIGVAFVLNIALGTIFGSLVPMFIANPAAVFSRVGMVDAIALCLFTFAVVMSSWATAQRDQDKEKARRRPLALLGIVMGVFSGIFCAAQAVSYAFATQHLQQLGNASSSTFLAPWLIFFVAAFIPYALYHFYLFWKE